MNVRSAAVASPHPAGTGTGGSKVISRYAGKYVNMVGSEQAGRPGVGAGVSGRAQTRGNQRCVRRRVCARVHQ